MSAAIRSATPATPTSAVPSFIEYGAADDRPSAPLVLGLPAMGTPARYYQPFAAQLAHAAGATVAWAELRGQGESTSQARRGADFGYREIVEHDIPALVDALRSRFPGRPLVIVGHSLGGQLATLALHRLGAKVAGLILVASGTAHFRAWPHGKRLRVGCVVAAVGLAAAVLPWYPGRRLGFGGDQPKRLMRDWTRHALTGRYRFDGSSVDHETASRGVALPVLALRIHADPLAPHGAVEDLLARLPIASVTRVAIDGVIADPPRRRHFSWARHPHEAAAHAARWIGALPPAAHRWPA